MIVRMRMVHVAIMVAVLGVVIMIVGVVVHPVHPLYFTRLRLLAQASLAVFVMMPNRAEIRSWLRAARQKRQKRTGRFS